MKNKLILTSILALFFLSAFKLKQTNKPNEAINKYIEKLQIDFSAIPEERKLILKELADYIQAGKNKNKEVNLIFICTHNSRRSHLSQIWAITAANYYGIKNIKSYSGGTESTAFNARAVAALERVGFVIENPGGENPHYQVKFSNQAPSIECFSKKYADASNPQKDFAAIMTCSQADAACPNVFGSDERISLPYDDPKASDGKPEEKATYDERCKQIATEICYAFSLVK
jgi:protein-tyrosine-phosphatase